MLVIIQDLLNTMILLLNVMIIVIQNYYQPEVFLILIFLKKSELIEYINPPLLLSFEKLGKQQTVFLGKHISKRAIKKAFQTTILPTKRGVGLVQPFLFNLRNLAIVLCSVGLLILIIELVFK